MLQVRRSLTDYSPLLEKGISLNSSQDFNHFMQPLSLSSEQFGPPLVRTILKRDFNSSPYPIHKKLNPFCPLCLCYVSPRDGFLTSWQACIEKTYIVHQKCLF